MVENKVENLEKQMEELRRELESVRGSQKHIDNTEPVDVIYDLYKEELEKEHMDEIVAFDIESKQIAGIGLTVREAYDNAKKNFHKEQFYLKRVGSKHLHRL